MGMDWKTWIPAFAGMTGTRNPIIITNNLYVRKLNNSRCIRKYTLNWRHCPTHSRTRSKVNKSHSEKVNKSKKYQTHGWYLRNHSKHPRNQMTGSTDRIRKKSRLGLLTFPYCSEICWMSPNRILFKIRNIYPLISGTVRGCVKVIVCKFCLIDKHAHRIKIIS